jgi:hypothetical protein
MNTSQQKENNTNKANTKVIVIAVIIVAIVVCLSASLVGVMVIRTMPTKTPTLTATTVPTTTLTATTVPTATITATVTTVPTVTATNVPTVTSTPVVKSTPTQVPNESSSQTIAILEKNGYVYSGKTDKEDGSIYINKSLGTIVIVFDNGIVAIDVVMGNGIDAYKQGEALAKLVIVIWDSPVAKVMSLVLTQAVKSPGTTFSSTSEGHGISALVTTTNTGATVIVIVITPSESDSTT